MNPHTILATRADLTDRARAFLASSPAHLGTAGPFTLWEHPTRGDTAPVYMLTPCGRIASTGFYDLGDLDAATCYEVLISHDADAARITLTTPAGGHSLASTDAKL